MEKRAGLVFLSLAFVCTAGRAQAQVLTEITPGGSAVTASIQDTNVPANVVDNNLSTRWSGNGNGAWIRLDLGASRTVAQLRVAVHQGNARRNSFDLQLSTDNVAWTTVFTGQSGGTTTLEETYELTDQAARYVRYVGRGGTLNAGGTTPWNSVTEISVYGPMGCPSPTPIPTPRPIGLVASSGDTQVSLAWQSGTPSTGAHKYEVLRSLTTGGPYTLVATVNTSGTRDGSHVDGGLTNGTRYFYVVREVYTWVYPCSGQQFTVTSANSDESSAVPAGGSTPGPTPTPSPTPSPTPTGSPTPSPTPTMPSGSTEITPGASAVTASTHDGNAPGNTVDNNLSTRWSGNGDGAWIRYDFGGQQVFTHVKIAVYNGNSRRNRFDLQVSHDGSVWNGVWSGESSGTTTQEETYDFPDISARYFRYLGHGSNVGTFNSLLEVSLFGPGGAVTPTATPTPTSGPGAPAKPTMRMETVSATEYNVIWDKWSGIDGTSWRLFENGVQIHSESLASSGGTHQGDVHRVTGKTYGAYEYRVVLVNGAGSTSSDPASIVMGGASKITIAPADAATQALQLTVSQGTTDFSLGMLSRPSPTFTLATNNSSVMSYQLVNGTTLRINATKAGRSSLKITETSSGEVRYVGVRIRTAAGVLPKMPDHVSVGSVSEDTPADLDFWRAYSSDLSNRRMDIRYVYINGGPINGWRNWSGIEGGRAITFVRESLKMGMIPFFVYYNIPEASESYDIDRANINNATYMTAYFRDLKFFLDIVKREAGDDLVGVVFEPDFIGYMMQNSGGSNPVPADQLSARADTAHSSGVLGGGDPTFPNTITGLVNAINYTTKKYAPNAYFGWQVNLWASPGVTTGIPSNGLMHKTDTEGISTGRAGIASEARAIADYYVRAGIKSQGAHFVSIDKYGLDAGHASPGNPAMSPWFWHADHWNNYLVFTRNLGDQTALPVILWQIPVGHINTTQSANPYGGSFPLLDNSATHYEDSAPVFFLGDSFKPGSSRFSYFRTNAGGDAKVTNNGTDTVTWGGHMQEAKDNRVISVLFGAGVGTSTDGVGSPPTDGYWWIVQAQKYFQNPVPLP